MYWWGAEEGRVAAMGTVAAGVGVRVRCEKGERAWLPNIALDTSVPGEAATQATWSKTAWLRHRILATA